MIEYAKLELKKNQLLLLGFSLMFAASLLPSGWLARRYGIPFQTGVDAALLFWSLTGVALFTLFSAAASGAESARGPLASAAESLPLSARRRAAGSLGAILAQALLFALGVSLAAMIASPSWRESVLAGAPPVDEWSDWKRNPFLRSFLLLELGLLPYIAAAAFAFSYWSGSGILGGLIAAVVTGAAAALCAGGLTLETLFDYRAPFAARAALCASLASAGAALALSRLCAWLGRRENRSWLSAGLPVIGLTLGAAASFASFAATHDDLLASSHFAPRDMEFIEEFTPASGPAAEPRQYLASMDGGLTIIGADGGRQAAIPGIPHSLGQIFGRAWEMRVVSILEAPDGHVWALRSHWSAPSGRYELWRGRQDEAMELWSRFSGRYVDRLVLRGNETGLLTSSWPEAKKRAYAPVPARGRAPTWTVVGEKAYAHLLAGHAAGGKSAKLSRDGRTLTAVSGGRPAAWRLPAPAYYPKDSEGRVAALQLGPDRVFALRLRGKPAVAFCLPGGKVAVRWQGSHALRGIQRTPAGTLWRIEGGRLFLMPAYAGEPDSVDLAPLYKSAPELLKAHGMQAVEIYDGRAWLAAGGLLLTISLADGSLLSRVELPKSLSEPWIAPVAPVPGGFFHHTGRRVYFIDLEGRARDLGKA